MKIRDHVLTLTLVGFLGAFALAFFVWWLTADMGEDADRLSDLSATSGKASEEYLATQKFLNRGREVVRAMDLLSNESSGLFSIVKDMLAEAKEDLAQLKDMHELPNELQATIQKTFGQFHQQSKKVGAAIEKIKEIQNSTDQVNLDDYEDAASAFVDVMKELENWAENLVFKHKENLQNERQRVAEGREISTWVGRSSFTLWFWVFSLGVSIVFFLPQSLAWPLPLTKPFHMAGLSPRIPLRKLLGRNRRGPGKKLNPRKLKSSQGVFGNS